MFQVSIKYVERKRQIFFTRSVVYKLKAMIGLCAKKYSTKWQIQQTQEIANQLEHTFTIYFSTEVFILHYFTKNVHNVTSPKAGKIVEALSLPLVLPPKEKLSEIVSGSTLVG